MGEHEYKVVVYLDYGEIFYVLADDEEEAKQKANNLFIANHLSDLCTKFMNAEIDVNSSKIEKQ